METHLLLCTLYTASSSCAVVYSLHQPKSCSTCLEPPHCHDQQQEALAPQHDKEPRVCNSSRHISSGDTRVTIYWVGQASSHGYWPREAMKIETGQRISNIHLSNGEFMERKMVYQTIAQVSKEHISPFLPCQCCFFFQHHIKILLTELLL